MPIGLVTSKAIRKRRPLWEWIRSIGSAVSEDTPALQMADLIAWGQNRLANGSSLASWETDPYYTRAVKARSTISGNVRTVGEKALSSSVFPDEGFDTINPQRRRQQRDWHTEKYLLKI
jgi:hypothetical protein